MKEQESASEWVGEAAILALTGGWRSRLLLTAFLSPLNVLPTSLCAWVFALHCPQTGLKGNHARYP